MPTTLWRPLVFPRLRPGRRGGQAPPATERRSASGGPWGGDAFSSGGDHASLAQLSSGAGACRAPVLGAPAPGRGHSKVYEPRADIPLCVGSQAGEPIAVLVQSFVVQM